MTRSLDAAQKLSVLFEEQLCWTIAPLALQLGYSIPSTRRILTHRGYYSSFTHNGRWYTLSSIPLFDADGLWFHRDIGFSMAGSLTRTLVDLTTRSPDGMSAESLGKKLRCRCHSILVHLYRQDRLQRQRFGRSYIYLASDSHTAEKQCLARQKPVELPAEIAVLVLAQFIRNPGTGFQALAKKVSKSSGLTVGSDQIRALFAEHGIKKTA